MMVWSLVLMVVSLAMVNWWLLMVAACISMMDFLEVVALARLSRASMRLLGAVSFLWHEHPEWNVGWLSCGAFFNGW